jgi:hypothetical protein
VGDGIRKVEDGAVPHSKFGGWPWRARNNIKPGAVSFHAFELSMFFSQQEHHHTEYLGHTLVSGHSLETRFYFVKSRILSI